MEISEIQLNKVIETINTENKTSYKIVCQFSTGEWGAYRIADNDNNIAVLKFFLNLEKTNIIDPDPTLAIKITDKLRQYGYPVSKYLYSGKIEPNGMYWIQEFLNGEPLWKDPSVDQVKSLLSFLKLQKGNAVSSKQNLSNYVIETVFNNAYGKATKMENYSDETRCLLDKARDLAKEAKGIVLPSEDIVHGDFSYHQAMIVEDTIIGIIDWEESGCGDWLIDLTRLIYSLHDRPPLAEPIVKELRETDERKIKLYTAYTVLEMISFPTNNYNKPISEGAINKAQSAMNFVANKIW